MITKSVYIRYLGSNNKIKISISKINWEIVTYIEIYNKRLSNLNWIKKCPNLQELLILPCNLSSLSGLPEELPNLRRLDVRYNKLRSLKGLPQKLPNLQFLSILYNNINSLEDLPRELPNLEHLDLHNNNLSSLSGLPEELPNLQYLNLCHNKLSLLSGLPQKLPNLQHLNISDNDLHSLVGLPQELTDLDSLLLGFNNLISLSGLPEELPNLQYLYLHNNKLSSLSGLPEELPNLQELYSYNNNLSSLSGLPQELPNLQYLWVYNNNLSSLSDLPEELPNLQRINISSNSQITTLPNFLINYRNLQLLYCSGLELELEPRMRRWLNRLQGRHIGNTTQVYGNSQNVHDSSIQETVRQSMRRLLDQPNIPKQCLDTIRNQIVQDNILTPKSKDQLLEYIQSEEELHELCLTYADLLWVIWHSIHEYSEDIQCEIKSILNQELQDSDCKCFTGRMTRLVNCLNGFCDLVEVKILDSAQIGNIVLIIKQKLEASEEGYSVEKHKDEFQEEMLSRGESTEVISEWLEYIE